MAHRILIAFVLLLAALMPAQSGETFAIRDVRVFNGQIVLQHQTVIVREGKIAALGPFDAVQVPQGATELSGEGRTLMPGLIDAHVHVSQFYVIEALQQALSFGVTTVLDMWTGRQALTRFKELEAEDRPDLASVRTAGTGVTAPGGHPTQMDPMSARSIPTLESPEQAEAFVDARLSEGSDFIKIIYDNTSDAYGRDLPTLSEETIRAVVRAAHARGRLAVAHIGNERYARGAIDAGVDGLAHLFIGPTVSSDFGKYVKGSGAFVIPTLAILRSVCGKSDGPRILADQEMRKGISERFSVLSLPPPVPGLSCDAATLAVRQLSDAGVTLLAGTDSPGPGTAYGASLHLELEHLVDAGLTPLAALSAATSAPARVFGMTDRGQIKVGMRADLLLVEGDPSKEIGDTRRIVAIWKRGIRH